MSNPYLLAIHDPFAVFAGKTNHSVYFELGVDGAALTITDFKMQFTRIDKVNQANNTVSAEVALSAGSKTVHADNSGVFMDVTGKAADSLFKVDLPDTAQALDSDVCFVNIRNDVASPAIRSATHFKILHPPVLQNIIKERVAQTSSIITKTGTPGLQKYICIYTQFVGTAFQLEMLNSDLAISSEIGTAKQRTISPILGYYRHDGAGVIDQISGIARELGVTESVDLAGAGWGGASTEVGEVTGYTIIIPFETNFNLPLSGNNLTLFYNSGQFGNSIRGADGGKLTTLEGRPNFNKFYNNSGSPSSKVQDDIGSGGGGTSGGSGGSGWRNL